MNHSGCNINSAGFMQTVELTIKLAVDGTLVESHDVLRQSSRLVAEDVLDLSELLVECGGPRLGRGVTLGVIHLPVPVYEEAVPQADDLHAVTQVKGTGVRRRSSPGSVLIRFLALTYLT